MMSSNGFADFQNVLKNIDVDQTEVQRALRKGADTYTKRLRANTPQDPNASMAKKYGSMKSNLEVINDSGEVKVSYGDSFWWRFVEHGTPNQRAQNFARNTLTSTMNELNQIMSDEILKNIK